MSPLSPASSASGSTVRANPEPDPVAVVRDDDGVQQVQHPLRVAGDGDLDVAVGGGIADPVELAGEHHAAGVDDDHVLAQVLDDVELVAGEQHGRAAASDPAEQRGHRIHRDRVETRKRFVEHQQVRSVHEGGGKLHPLLVAVRQVIQARRLPVAETESAQPPVGLPRRRRGGQPGQSAEEHQLVSDPHLRIQAALFRHVPEPAPIRGTDRPPTPPHEAGVGNDKPENRAHRRRLPGPVWTDKAGQPAGAHLKCAARER